MFSMAVFLDCTGVRRCKNYDGVSARGWPGDWSHLGGSEARIHSRGSLGNISGNNCAERLRVLVRSGVCNGAAVDGRGISLCLGIIGR